MTKTDFSKLKKDELEKELINTRESLRAIKFKVEGARSKNVKEELNLRRKIAQMLTELNKNSKK